MLYIPLTLDEIVLLEEKVEDVLSGELLKILITLNRNERLLDFLELINHSEFIEKNNDQFFATPDQSIVVLGNSNLKAEDIIKTINKYGIEKDRLELHLDYHLKGFNIDSLKYSFKHSLILVGPVPHSIKGKDDYSSVISRLETENGFPPVKRLTVDNTLKITKTSIKKAINSALDSGILTI
jgi:hypothetical protein